MNIRPKLGEAIVPAIVLLGCLLYWLHVQDARSVAQRVPIGVILLTVAMTVFVLARSFVFAGPTEDTPAPEEPSSSREAVARRVAFLVLCGGYYVALGELGFNLANLLFLLLAYPLAGLSIAWSGVAAIISSVVFYVLARIMEFNVPTGPFGF